jgi:hypothetical protein
VRILSIKLMDMKKTILFSLFVGLSLYSTAQARFGIVGGGTLAKTNGAFNSTSRVGVFLGSEIDLTLGKSVSLRPQLKYVRKGDHIVSGEKGSYNYLELPINFVYNIPTEVGRFSLGGGPDLAYMVSGSWSVQGGPKEDIYFKYDQVNHFDYGLNLVAEFEIEGGVFFNVNYTLGLQDVWYADKIGTNKNRTVSLGLGVMF